jgi:hypothetical protein
MINEYSHWNSILFSLKNLCGFPTTMSGHIWRFSNVQKNQDSNRITIIILSLFCP